MFTVDATDSRIVRPIAKQTVHFENSRTGNRDRDFKCLLWDSDGQTAGHISQKIQTEFEWGQAAGRASCFSPWSSTRSIIWEKSPKESNVGSRHSAQSASTLPSRLGLTRSWIVLSNPSFSHGVFLFGKIQSHRPRVANGSNLGRRSSFSLR